MIPPLSAARPHKKLAIRDQVPYRGPMQTLLHTLKDGRALAYCMYGARDGYPLFFSHGSPGSRLEGAFFDKAARDYGLCIIAPDRPGFGMSTFDPNRKLLDFPNDIEQLADHLGRERFSVMGWSGGGCHALSCGASLKDRVDLIVSLAGYTHFAELPNAASHLRSWLDRASVSLAFDRPRLFSLFFSLMRLGIQHAPNLSLREVERTMSPPDRRILESAEVRETFLRDQQEATRQTGQAIACDSIVHYRDWGIVLSEITAQVLLFHGTEDWLVPIEYSRHLAAHLPRGELHELPGEGHLFPITYKDKLFEKLWALLPT